MYDYLRGHVVKIRPHSVVLDVSNIGFSLQVPVRHAALLEVGKESTLYVCLIAREPDMTLYGFINEQERELFHTLLSVAGVGPKLALALIGHLSIDDFHQLAMDGDIDKLKLVPGVGKRTAERLLVELKGKFEKGLPDSLKPLSPDKASFSTLSSEAVDALISLGYQQKDARKVVQEVLKEVEDEMSLSELVTRSLQMGVK